MDEDSEWALRRLSALVNNLQRMRDEYPDISNHYPNWRTRRTLTIQMIGDLQEKLNTVYKNARIASGAGSFISLAGSIATIVGTILSFKGVSSANNWSDAGSALRVTGDITVPVTALLEIGISKYYMRDLKTIVENDKEASRPMLHWLQYSRNLDEGIREMFGCSIFSDIWNDVLLACTEVGRLAEAGSFEALQISIILRERLKGRIADDALEEIIQSCLRLFAAARTFLGSAGRGVLKTLQRIAEIVNSEPVQVCIASAKLYGHVNGLTDLVECARNNSAQAVAPGQCTTHEITTKCLSEALCILIDIMNIINSKNGFLDGESSHSKKLGIIKGELQTELDRMDNFIICYENRP